MKQTSTTFKHVRKTFSYSSTILLTGLMYLSVLLGGGVVAQKSNTPRPPAALSSPLAPAGLSNTNTSKKAVQSVTLIDGQTASMTMGFAPGADGGPAYPPRGKFSKDNPAYYPVSDERGPVKLAVQTSQKEAKLVLRARSSAPAGQTPVPVDRIEYRVNNAAWQKSSAEQVIALLPSNGKAVYTIELRLRLTGEEPATTSQLVLNWSIEGS